MRQDPRFSLFGVQLDNLTISGDTTTAGQMTATSAAMGKETTAGGAQSVAMGKSTSAEGVQSVAMGELTIAARDNSVAMGKETTAAGNQSVAMGELTSAGGLESVAMGYMTTAARVNSVAMGQETTAAADYSVAMGQYNDPDSSYLLCVGNGDDNSNRKNALTLDTTGNLVVSGNLTVQGDTTTVNTTEVTIEDTVLTIAKGAMAQNIVSGNPVGIEVGRVHSHLSNTMVRNGTRTAGFNPRADNSNFCGDRHNTTAQEINPWRWV